MLYIVLFVFLLGKAATQEIKAVTPVAAESYPFSMEDLKYVCISVTFDLQTVFRTLIHDTTLISPSAKSDFVLNITFPQSQVDLTLSCITTPMAQLAEGKIKYQIVKQCYKINSPLPYPLMISIDKSTVMDLYQEENRGHSMLLLSTDVPLAGALDFTLHRGNPSDDIEGVFQCETKDGHWTNKCPNGCIDVCPYGPDNTRFECLNEPKSNVHHKGYNDFVGNTDRLLINLHTGRISFARESNTKLIPARRGDSFLQCPPPGISKMCDYTSIQDICMVRMSKCSTRKVPEHLPVHSVYIGQFDDASFTPGTLQPLVDPLAYCFTISKWRSRKFIEMCTKSLLAVPRASLAYVHQHQFANGSFWEDTYVSEVGSFALMTKREPPLQHKNHYGAFILVQAIVLTSAVAFFLYSNGQIWMI